MFDTAVVEMIKQGIIETIYMTLFSSFLAYVFGLPLGILLVITDKDGIAPLRIVNIVLGTIINIIRSVPFIILLIAVIPLTRAIIGTTLGSTATVIPLVIASAPYVARLVEASLKEVDGGVIEAAQSMGASVMEIIVKVLIPESMPALISGAAIAVTTILGYSAMSGFVGGGGLGDIAIRYGYYRYENEIMFVTVAILIIIVQIFQEVGNRWTKHSDKRI
jgi:D-methionine transport system permease protein